MTGLTGLEAISAHGGWSIAILGISIVFSGLTLLSLTIAQLHKMLDVWERRHTYREWFRTHSRARAGADETTEPEGPYLPEDIAASAQMYKILIEHIGEHPFSLPKILDLAVHRGLPHPFAMLNDLLLAKVIIPNNDGFFIWNEAVCRIPLTMTRKPKTETKEQ